MLSESCSFSSPLPPLQSDASSLLGSISGKCSGQKKQLPKNNLPVAIAYLLAVTLHTSDGVSRPVERHPPSLGAWVEETKFSPLGMSSLLSAAASPTEDI